MKARLFLLLFQSKLPHSMITHLHKAHINLVQTIILSLFFCDNFIQSPPFVVVSTFIYHIYLSGHLPGNFSENFNSCYLSLIYFSRLYCHQLAYSALLKKGRKMNIFFCCLQDASKLKHSCCLCLAVALTVYSMQIF